MNGFRASPLCYWIALIKKKKKQQKKTCWYVFCWVNSQDSSTEFHPFGHSKQSIIETVSELIVYASFVLRFWKQLPPSSTVAAKAVTLYWQLRVWALVWNLLGLTPDFTLFFPSLWRLLNFSVSQIFHVQNEDSYSTGFCPGINDMIHIKFLKHGMILIKP